jgi:hypothetical protein
MAETEVLGEFIGPFTANLVLLIIWAKLSYSLHSLSCAVSYSIAELNLNWMDETFSRARNPKMT